MVNNIHNTRMRFGLSHKRLSELSGVDVSMIRRIEYGWEQNEEIYNKLVEALNKARKGEGNETDV